MMFWSHTERSPHDAVKPAHPKPFMMYVKCESEGLPIISFSTLKFYELT